MIQRMGLKGMKIVSDEVLTIEEAAEVLKVTPEVVTGLLEDGDLPGRPIGGEWRTTKRALISFVDCVPLQMACCCAPVASASGAEMSAVGTGCCDPNTGCC